MHLLSSDVENNPVSWVAFIAGGHSSSVAFRLESVFLNEEFEQDWAEQFRPFRADLSAAVCWATFVCVHADLHFLDLGGADGNSTALKISRSPITPADLRKAWYWLTRFVKSRLNTTNNGKLEVQILKGQESFRIKSFIKSNIWVLLPSGKSKFKSGDLVDCFLPNCPNIFF